MSFPATGTFDLPNPHPAIADAAARAWQDLTDIRFEMVAAASGGKARDGHVCVNAWVYDEDLEHVLLVKHPRFGWTIPGGHLDPGEDLIEGVRRELREETGLPLKLAIDDPVAVLGGAIPATATDPEHVHYVLSYAVVADLDAPLSPEANQPAQWFPLDEPLPEGRFGDNWHAHRHAAVLRAGARA